MDPRNAKTRADGKDGRREDENQITWHPRVRASAHVRIPDLLKKGAHWKWLPPVIVAFFLQPALAQSETPSDISPDRMQTGSLLLRMQSGYDVATRLNTDIEARISGLAARVKVRQTFLNDGPEWVEGVYVFPLPDKAAVDRMRMVIGERVVEGEIREKDDAKETYEAARAAGKKTSLVEQQRANIFTTSVANIGPQETVIVEIEYLETLRYDEGSFSLRFPLTLTPRYIPGTPLPGRKGNGWAPDTTAVPDASLITPPVVTRSRDHKVSFEATINAGLPLGFIASRYHPVDINEESGRYRVSLADSSTPMDHDLELTWRPVADSMPRATIFKETAAGNTYLLIMLLPPDDAATPIAPMPRELVFVIDTSGSMHGTSLAQAKQALTLALDGLKPADRFNIVQFNSATSALFRDSVDATGNNIGIAKRFVTHLKANGGTEMRPALSLVLGNEPPERYLRQVIFVTDGSVGNEDELFTLIEQKLGSSRLFTVGIGSAPNGWFMRKAAEAGHGTFTMISAQHEVKEKMEQLFRKLEQPRMVDIAVEWPNGMSVEAYPATIPDLYSGEPVVIRAQISIEPKPADQLKISGNSVFGSWGAESGLAGSEPSPGIAALWARARIEDLLHRERRGLAAGDVREAIVDTALSHHLVSKYTSLVAVDKTPSRPAGKSLSQEQVPNLLPYGQSMDAIFGFPATATGAGMYRMNGLLLIATAIFLTLVLLGRRRRDDAPDCG